MLTSSFPGITNSDTAFTKEEPAEAISELGEVESTKTMHLI